MTDDPAEANTTKKFRSPAYPMFDLSKAVERLKSFYAKALHHQVGIGVLAEAWGMKSGDGKVWRAAAAMIQYGLLTDSGTGKSRKFQIADTAKRIVLDTSPESEKRTEVLKAAALAPMIHREIWQRFKSTAGLADSVIRNYLTLDRAENGESPYSPSAADEVLKTYRATLAYAGLSDSDTVTSPASVMEKDDGEGSSPQNPTKVSAGDLVKWISGGIVQFDARKVSWISDDGSHLRVIGSNTGIPMNEVEKVDPASVAAVKSEPTPPPQPSTPQPAPATQTGKTGKLSNVSTSVIGNRLQISADVNADEIDPLLDMLKKYKEILTLMN